MNLINLYDEVRSPLENAGLLKTMFATYLKTSNFEEFYTKLMCTVEVKNFRMENESFGIEASKKFSVILFKLWRYNILNTPIDKIPFRKYNNDDKRYLELRDSLQCMDEIEFIDYTTRVKRDSDLDIFNWFRWDNDWTYISSYDINLSQILEIDKEHILYINVNSASDLYKILKKFIEQCIRFNLPYNFKYSNDINKDSTIVIYSDTKNLTNYVNILKGICNDSELRLTLSRPKILSGTIDSYIGYESKVYSKDEDFTIERLKYIYDVLDEAIPKLYDEDFKILIGDYIDVTYEDYIISEVGRVLDRKIEEKKGKIIDYQILKSKLNKLRDTKFDDLEDIEIKVGLKNKVIFTKESIRELISNQINSIFRKYPEYINNILKRIALKFEEKGIDPKTACFSLVAIDKIKDYDLMARNGAIIVPERKSTMLGIIPKSNNDKFGYFIAPDGKVYPSFESYNKAKEKVKKHG